MKNDPIQTGAKTLSGQVQETAGKAVPGEDPQCTGLCKQVPGSAEKAIAEAKRGLRQVTAVAWRTR